jgi:hypothetical protein
LPAFCRFPCTYYSTDCRDCLVSQCFLGWSADITYSCDVLTDDILQKAVLESSESKGEYVRNALVRKLTKDGFLPPKAE